VLKLYFHNQVTRRKQIQSGLCLLTFLFLIGCFWTKTGNAAGVESFHWGLTVDELNQALSKEGSSDFLIREDNVRLGIEVPYAPTKAIKISRGRLRALFQAKKTTGPESLGQLFGYLYDGKLFGRVELLKETPWTSLQEVIRGLKKKFPDGKVFRSFGGSKEVSYFEYLGDNVYVFTNDQGVYYFEPQTLNKVVREGQQIIDSKESKMREEEREMIPSKP
jgi:hypothetical protein